MEKLREFKDLDEEGRKEAFEKFVRRQKVRFARDAASTEVCPLIRASRTSRKSFATVPSSGTVNANEMPPIRTPTAPPPEATDPNPTAGPPRPRAPIDAPAATSAPGTTRIGIGTLQSIVPETRIVRGISGTGMRGMMMMSARARTSTDGRARMSRGRGGWVKLPTSRRRKSMSTRYVVRCYLTRHDLTPLIETPVGR